MRRDVQEKPPKWSKELLEWRRRQHLLARQRNYAEAQKVKKVTRTLNTYTTHNILHRAVYSLAETI
jgi:hypothetical protein